MLDPYGRLERDAGIVKVPTGLDRHAPTPVVARGILSVMMEGS